MKIEKIHIAIVILIIALAAVGTHYMSVSPTLRKSEIYSTADGSAKFISLTSPTSGVIDTKAFCENSYTRHSLNEGQSVTTTCGDIDVHFKLKTTFMGSAGTNLMVIEITTTDNTPPDPCAGITCGDYCDGTILYTNGNCVNGQCNYDTQYNSPECGYVPPVDDEHPADDEPPYVPPVDDEEPPIVDDEDEGIINTVLMYGIGSVVFLVMLLIIVKKR